MRIRRPGQAEFLDRNPDKGRWAWRALSQSQLGVRGFASPQPKESTRSREIGSLICPAPEPAARPSSEHDCRENIFDPGAELRTVNSL